MIQTLKEHICGYTLIFAAIVDGTALAFVIVYVGIEILFFLKFGYFVFPLPTVLP